jgi:drug/metabolite transporter (DMT)-like permease
MDIQIVNEAFNEALEEMGEGSNKVFSMEFAKHHEAELEQRITRYRNQNAAQNMGFLLVLAALVFAIRKGVINPSIYGLNNNSFTGLIFLWVLIALNSFLIGRRNKKVALMEKQLMLIGVYKKITEKSVLS